MRWALLIAGGLYLVMFVVGGAQMALSERRRQLWRRQGTKPALMLAAIAFAAGGSIAGALRSPPSLLLAVLGILPMAVLGGRQRRRLRARDDLPPPLARMLEVPMNPLKRIRHPVRTWKAQWAVVGHPIRSRREAKEWEARQLDE